MNSLSPWYGSKCRLAKAIHAAAGPHHSWFDIFCGSCAAFLTKPRCGIEILNDLHGDIVTLAMVLASDRWQELYERASRTLYAEPLFLASREALAGDFTPPLSPADVTAEHVDRAFHWLVTAWQGQHGLAGTAGTRAMHFGLRYKGHGVPSKTWQSVADSLHTWHARLKGVTISRRDAFKMLATIPDEAGVAIYADPPYLKKSNSYRHDFADGDHERLAGALRRFTQARVVVSYYDHPALADLYPGWQIQHLDVAKSIAHSGRGKTRVSAPEVLLTNGPGAMTGTKTERRRNPVSIVQRLLFPV